MLYKITVKTVPFRPAVQARLRDLTQDGPFRVRDLAPAGGGHWDFLLQPTRPDMAIGFGKVAEFLILLAREFDVQSVEHLPTRTVAAAS